MNMHVMIALTYRDAAHCSIWDISEYLAVQHAASWQVPARL